MNIRPITFTKNYSIVPKLKKTEDEAEIISSGKQRKLRDLQEPKASFIKPIQKEGCYINDTVFEDLPTCSIPKKGQVARGNRVFNRTVTAFFRPDLNWEKLAQYIKENFKNIDDTNIYCFGCSKGQEPYSLAMLLKSRYNGADFKIKAYDIKPEIILNNMARSKKTTLLNHEDMMQILMLSDLDNDSKELEQFVEPSEFESTYKLRSDIVNSVTFKEGNILESVDNIDSNKKSIIMCRNMWPYIKQNEYEAFASKLYDKLAPESIVIIGSYDYGGRWGSQDSNKFPNTLLYCGFKPVDEDEAEPLIFKK